MTIKHVLAPARRLVGVSVAAMAAFAGCVGPAPSSETGTLGVASQAVTGDVYRESWEQGVDGWTTSGRAGDSVDVVSDSTAPSPSHAQSITYPGAGGNYLS